MSTNYSYILGLDKSSSKSSSNKKEPYTILSITYAYYK